MYANRARMFDKFKPFKNSIQIWSANLYGKSIFVKIPKLTLNNVWFGFSVRFEFLRVQLRTNTTWNYLCFNIELNLYSTQQTASRNDLCILECGTKRFSIYISKTFRPEGNVFKCPVQNSRKHSIGIGNWH